MKWQDLDVALDFFEESSTGIVIQVISSNDLPLIRRHIISRLGVPSFNMQRGLKYGHKHIMMVCLASARPGECMGYADNQLFYIGWASGKDLDELTRLGIHVSWRWCFNA